MIKMAESNAFFSTTHLRSREKSYMTEVIKKSTSNRLFPSAYIIEQGRNKRNGACPVFRQNFPFKPWRLLRWHIFTIFIQLL